MDKIRIESQIEAKPCNGCVIPNCEYCPHVYLKLEEIELELKKYKIEN